MTINNPKLYLEGIWDWAILDGCFGRTKISPTDLDGFVERKGKFLLIETKKPNVIIPKGQLQTFLSLQRTGLFTIIVVWGQQNSPEYIQLFTRNGIGKKKRGDLNKFRAVVSAWYDFANNEL